MPPTASYKILIAEDNELNAKLIKKLVEFCGHSARTVHDGNDAVEAVRKNKFDLILMDLEMPGMDGFEASRAIRKFDGETPILSISAPTDPGHAQLCIQNGMDGHIYKSAPVEEYNSKIEAAVTKRKMAGEKIVLYELLKNKPYKN